MSAEGLGSGQQGQQLDAVHCANATACCLPASKVCQNCRLVAYCSRECQKQHWKLHKVHCKSYLMEDSWLPSWIREKRAPSFIATNNSFFCEDSPEIALSQPFKGEWLWGNVPAYGLLGSSVLHSGNEDDNLCLCFAASGDLRNVIETVCQIPDNFNGRVDLYVNDSNPKVMLRNFLMLELLRVHGAEAIDAVISLWYSMALTSPQLTAVRALARQAQSWPLSEGGTYTYTSSFCSSMPDSLVAQFSKVVVGSLLNLSRNNLSLETATKMRSSVMMSRPDLAERRMGSLRPAHRVVWHHFMQCGLLLPFGSQALAANYDKANQFLFTPVLGWTLGDGSDPLDGWDIKLIKITGISYGVPSNDLYGCLFFHLRAKLQLFLNKWKLGRIRVVLTDMDASDLATHLRQKRVRLHRVDTSNLADDHYKGINKVLKDWAPLLNPHSGNLIEPILITYFLNWALFYSQEKQNVETFADPAVTKEEMQVACHRGLLWGKTKEGFPELVRRITMCGNSMWYMYFHDFTRAFDEYLKMHTTLKETNMMGIKRKRTHAVVPHRLFVSVGARSNDTPPLDMEDFYVHNCIGYNHTMTERFVEWMSVKTEGTTEEL